MRNSIRMPSSIYERAKAHLLGGRGERYGFFLANVSRGPRGTDLLVREFLPVPEEAMQLTIEGFELPPSAWVGARNRAYAENAVLIEAHSHPLGPAGFSTTDEEWGAAFASYILDDLPGRPYAAMVWANGSLDGRMWPASGQEWTQLDELRVVGLRCETVRMTGADEEPEEEGDPGYVRYARQLPAVGTSGQEALRRVRVGVVGLGGLGSISVLQLAYLGVRRFVLADRDTVDGTSLNRLIGAGPSDVGTSKTVVMEREVRRVAGGEPCEIRTFGDLRSAETLGALTGVDVIVGALDNDAARLVLNEIAVAYVIPYFDLGVGIDSLDNRIADAGGRVVYVHPDGPCLLCSKGYSPRIAAEEMMDPADRERARARGYIAGRDEPSPSVVTLNTVVAGLAMTEFLALVTGLRPPVECIYYDLLGGGTVTTRLRRNKNCVVCAYTGYGPEIHLKRYLTPT